VIEKVVRRGNLKNFSEIKENLAYWLSRKPEERIAALEQLRRQHDGSSTRLQRSARVIQYPQS
jgi:hypothetical protein